MFKKELSRAGDLCRLADQQWELNYDRQQKTHRSLSSFTQLQQHDTTYIDREVYTTILVGCKHYDDELPMHRSSKLLVNSYQCKGQGITLTNPASAAFKLELELYVCKDHTNPKRPRSCVP